MICLASQSKHTQRCRELEPFRNTLAVVEFARSVILLIGAGLMIRSLQSLMDTNLGFQRDHLLIICELHCRMRDTGPAEQVAAFDKRQHCGWNSCGVLRQPSIVVILCLAQHVDGGRFRIAVTPH